MHIRISGHAYTPVRVNVEEAGEWGSVGVKVFFSLIGDNAREKHSNETGKFKLKEWE